MNINFDKAFNIILSLERGYVNDPNDPGGETKYGISKHSFPHLDIKNLTLDEAKDIYYKYYWIPSGADALAWPMCLYVFDCAINQGVGIAKQLYLANTTAINFMSARALRYTRMNNFNIYGKGWFNRLFTLAISHEQ